ncbi:hypothetical protein [Chloroflexus sp.]|nr:hypothetical protein [Chloroflexus sp.]
MPSIQRVSRCAEEKNQQRADSESSALRCSVTDEAGLPPGTALI